MKKIKKILGVLSKIYCPHCRHNQSKSKWKPIVIDNQQLNSQTYLSNIIEIIPYYIFWKNVNSIYLGCNKKFAQLVGKNSPEEVIGKTDFELNWGQGEAEDYQFGDRNTISGDPTINIEEALLRPDGSKIIMLVNKVPLVDKNGDCIGILGTSTEITELKNTQHQLKEAAEALRALSGSMAHELRTPLSTIHLGIHGARYYLPKLVKAYNLAKQHQLDVEPIKPEYLKILSSTFDSIESKVKYTETILNMLLMNIKQNIISTDNFKVYSINECIDEALLRYPFKQHEIELVHCDKKNDFSFYGDKILMVHILFNLLKNSLYYLQTTEKGVIQIWTENNENNHILYFKDTGSGIPENVLPKLFERFYTTTNHGTGLGLAFCKMVMTSFDGSIKCTSIYGEFTCFEMIFPKK